jgi:hypothetical protein
MMAETPSTLRGKRIPKSISKPTETGEAVAVVMESVVAIPVKAPKAHKNKLVRDSFTMPKDEYQVLDALKHRALGLEKHVRKSELLRAGLQALAAMSERAFLKAIGTVPTLKTGRPKAE